MIGRVYKIIVNCSNEIYIGSTFQEPRARWQDHKKQYKYWKENATGSKLSSFDLFDKYGIENCKIILIKEYEVCDRTHLEAYEQLWINRLNPINKNNPFCIEKLWQKNYYEEHKEQQIQKSKEYYQKNREEIIEKNKEYREEHKEQRNQKSKEYYQKNREKRLEKVICECGCEVNNSSLSRHKKSKKHQEFMKTLS